MREILSRGKRIYDREWVEGYYMPRPNTVGGERHYIIKRGSCVWFSLNVSTLCQYTGLHDKTKWEELSEKEQQQFLSEWNYEKDRKNQKEDWKGKKIWENDIVAFIDVIPTETGYLEQNCCGQVLWDNDKACYCVTGRLSAASYEVLGGCKVIGNIFDNPELLDN